MRLSVQVIFVVVVLLSCLGPGTSARSREVRSADSCPAGETDSSCAASEESMAPAVFSAAVLGASGNVGGAVVSSLLTRPEIGRIVLLNRRKIEKFDDVEKVEQHIVPMEAGLLEKATLPLLRGVDAVFITMGVGAPSKSTVEELELVDVTLPTEFARSAKAGGVRHASLLTSVGADVHSKPWFLMNGTAVGHYMQLKGQIEENVKSLGFESVSIFRPGTLVGSSRTPKLMNWAGMKVNFLLPDRYRSIEVPVLAEAMTACALKALATPKAEVPTTQTFEGSDIRNCASGNES